jgi:GNAT superfamily N-acetyltransferase
VPDLLARRREEAGEMTLVVRAATAADAEAIARLCGELGYPTAATDVEVRRGAIEASPEHVLLVAEVDGIVLGWLHASVVHSIEYERHAEIRGLVVDARARSRALGARLVAAAEHWALSRGIALMRVRSQILRERAHRFYERVGYNEIKQQKVFDKRLVAG